MESLICTNILKNFEASAGPMLNKDPNSHKVSDWYSIFPIENKELVYGKWEDKIIWDSEAVDKIPSVESFCLDPNDESIILNLPEDEEPVLELQEEATSKKEYKSKTKMKRSNNDEVYIYIVYYYI